MYSKSKEQNKENRKPGKTSTQPEKRRRQKFCRESATDSSFDRQTDDNFVSIFAFARLRSSTRMAYHSMSIVTMVVILSLTAYVAHSKDIICYCEGHCRDHSHNGTCVIQEGDGFCFAFVHEVFDRKKNILEPEWFYGCTPPGEKGLLQCKGDLSVHEIPKSIHCCSGPDFCNQQLKPAYKATPHEEFIAEQEEWERQHSFRVYITPFNIMIIILVSLITTLFTLLAILVRDHVTKRRERQMMLRKHMALNANGGMTTC